VHGRKTIAAVGQGDRISAQFARSRDVIRESVNLITVSIDPHAAPSYKWMC
jgi:hypothetical protein